MKFNYKYSASLFLLGLPFLLFSALSIFYFEDKKELTKEIIAFMLFNVVVWSLYFLVSRKKQNRILAFTFMLLVSTISLVKLGFVHLYHTKISGSALFVIFETNRNEAIEYLNTYLDVNLLLLLLLHYIPLLLLLFFYKKEEIFYSSKKKTRVFFLVIVMCLSIYQIQKRFYNQDLFFRIYNSYQGYSKYKEGLTNRLSNPKPVVNGRVFSKNEEAQTHIVIIGESLTKHHMNLYGYPRNTNPELEKIKDELVIFGDVISPHTHTITSLEKILTLSSFSSPNPEDNLSIVQLANLAGYDTYWISNQEPIGITETIPTIIGNAADSKYWMETENFYAKIHDGKLLPQLKKILNKPNKRKVVFLHMIGVHGTYDKRYPAKFNYFKDTPPNIISKSSRAIKYTNYYDNAVRYNDHVVSEIISLINKKNINSSVVYFSDHGQEVFDTINFMGHNEYNSTKPMYEIPLIFWFSPKYKAFNSLNLKTIEDYKNRKYQLEDFPHVFADYTGIHFSGLDFKKSILNKRFVYKDRIIKNEINYDDL